MTVNEYQKLAMVSLNPDLSRQDMLLNAVMGLCGESGEAIDIVKKELFQGHALDAEKLKKEFPEIKIIIITSQPEYSYISRAREIGVESFWYKEPTAEALIKVMDRTMAGESLYPDSTPITRLGAALSNDFTERELEVLRELVNGKTDAAIAETLCLSVTRVKQHIQHIREKTQFSNRTELAVRTRESGLVIGDYKAP